MPVAVVLGSLASSLLNFRQDLLLGLQRAGFEVVACAPYEGDEIACRLSDLGVEFVTVPMQRARISPVRDVLLLLQLRRLFIARRPELVIAYTVKPVIFGMLAGWLTRVPRRAALITGLGYAFTAEDGSRRLLRRILIALYRVALRRATTVFFQNADDCDYFKSVGILDAGRSVCLTPGSGVDLGYFHPVALPAEPVFLMIGRYLEDKGFREFVDAARQVKARLPQARFKIVGWTDVNPSAIPETVVQRWVDEGVVENLGRLDSAGVKQAIAACRVYVLPSYREGTPRTVLEAMAMGRPIITTDVPGCRDTTVDGVNGFLVPARQVEPLALAMERLIREPALVEAMGRASRLRAETIYDVRAVTQLMLEELGVA